MFGKFGLCGDFKTIIIIIINFMKILSDSFNHLH